MAKNQRTIYLENDILGFILDYQQQHGLSNISIAIERIVLEKMFKEDIDIKPTVKSKPIQQKEEPKVIPKSIMNIRNTMRD